MPRTSSYFSLLAEYQLESDALLVIECSSTVELDRSERRSELADSSCSSVLRAYARGTAGPPATGATFAVGIGGRQGVYRQNQRN